MLPGQVRLLQLHFVHLHNCCAPSLLACTAELSLQPCTPPAVFACTVLYEMFIPVSVVGALVLPLYYAWVLYDNWWLSPIFIALLVMTPLKFCPLSEICLLWPGII